MLIQDLQFLENARRANKVKGSEASKLWWQQTNGNFGAAIADTSALGRDTFSVSAARVAVEQGVGSISSSYARASAISGEDNS